MSACHQREDVGKSASSPFTLQGKGRIPVFKNLREFNETLAKTQAMTDEEYLRWMSQLGTTTLRGLTIRMHEEEAEIGRMSSIARTQSDSIEHGPTFTDNPRAFYISMDIDKIDGDTAMWLSPNVGFEAYADLIDADGLVRIQNTLWQFKSDSARYILNAAPTLDRSAFEPGSQELVLTLAGETGIILNPDEDGGGDPVPPPAPTGCQANPVPMAASWHLQNSAKGSDGTKVIAYVNFFGADGGADGYYYYQFRSKVVPLKKRRGWWYDTYKAICGRSAISYGNQVQGNWQSSSNGSGTFPVNYASFTFSEPSIQTDVRVPSFESYFTAQGATLRNTIATLRVDKCNIQPEVQQFQLNAGFERDGNNPTVVVTK